MAGNEEFKDTTREIKLERQTEVKSGGTYIRRLTVFCRKLKPIKKFTPRGHILYKNHFYSNIVEELEQVKARDIRYVRKQMP